MAERLFGVETEYALAAMAGSRGVERHVLLGRLFEQARLRLPHLPDRMGSGMFLENGGRFYADSGQHPEMATPECANPWDAVRYIQAGERMLETLLAPLVSGLPPNAEVMCFRTNVDYGGSKATWGCHESYLHHCDPAALPKQLIPHLVTRVIYTGAGGFSPLAEGVEYTLSPRASHIVKVISGDSTGNRGIFHTKDETLCGGRYHRLHVLCGESLCSETASWLKVGATALVVAMIDAGLDPGEGVVLAAPLEALRTTAADPTCQTRLKLAGGGSATALSVQSHYLAQAVAHQHDGFMPPWAPEVCHRWGSILEDLKQAPESVATALDWAIKLALYRRHGERRGIPGGQWPFWNRVLAKLNAALQETDYRGQVVGLDLVLGPASPIPEAVARLTPALREQSLHWDGLRAFLQLRRELFELDTRFGQLGERGVFQHLNRAGVLTHHVPGVDNIEHAIANPPAIGRARLRGEVVRRFAGHNGQYRCDWQSVWDQAQRRLLDLSDPFAAEEHWRELPPPEETPVDDDLLAHLLGLRESPVRAFFRRRPPPPPAP